MRGSFLRNMGCFFNRVACCPECHTSSSEMPHFDKVNAAFRECSSVAFALVKCGVCLVEVWHSGQWSVVSLYAVAVVLFNDNVVFFSSLLILSPLTRARASFHCFNLYYSSLRCVFPFRFFSSSFLIILQSFCISLTVSIKINGRFFCECRKSYPEKDIKSIGTSNIFPYLCPIIELWF